MEQLNKVKVNPKIKALIEASGSYLSAKGYTDHGLRHVICVASSAKNLLQVLNFSEREIELASIAAWLHDIGNSVNRINHAITGASMAFTLLSEMNFSIEDILDIILAIGNHDENSEGAATNAISAALIIADKSDIHKDRVDKKKKEETFDIHDKVNLSIKSNVLTADAQNKLIKLTLTVDETSSIFDFFQIYSARIKMCEKAANFLGCKFLLVVNNFVANYIENKSFKINPFENNPANNEILLN